MNLFSLFYQAVNRYPERLALMVDETGYSYKELNLLSRKVAHLLAVSPGQQIGIFANKTLSAYIGLLGALAVGKTYVPINFKFSAQRNQNIIELTEINTLVVDEGGLKQISENMNLKGRMTLIFPETDRSQIHDKILQQHQVYDRQDLEDSVETFQDCVADSLACIIFTSGSTGVPKGVKMGHQNLVKYFKFLQTEYRFDENDRFSMVYDLSFDPSLHNMFLAWQVGAALYIVPEKSLLAPAKFIKENKLTVWNSVPSMIHLMKKFGMLKSNVFPDLKFTVIGGEALSFDIVEVWRKAAPNSIIENHYGPTETTIGIVKYRIPADLSETKMHNGIVSIGKVYESQEFCLINATGEKVEDEGELYLSGYQVNSGYWKAPELTALNFVFEKDSKKIWYKTGDWVIQKKGYLFFVSRTDYQVKIRGFRVELEEVSLAIKNILPANFIYTIAHPIVDGRAENIYAFIEGETDVEKIKVLAELKNILPEYMIPRDLIPLKEFPLNPHGKIDRKKLIELIK